MFVTNGSGLGPLCDSLVTRPQIQLIQAVHEGQAVAMADGYAKASGKIGFGMYSRVGLPHSSSNMYNARKDRTPLVLLSDHSQLHQRGNRQSRGPGRFYRTGEAIHQVALGGPRGVSDSRMGAQGLQGVHGPAGRPHLYSHPAQSAV